MDADKKQQKLIEPPKPVNLPAFRCRLIAAAQPPQKICVYLRPSAVNLL
jgi:hypothetical protein